MQPEQNCTAHHEAREIIANPSADHSPSVRAIAWNIAKSAIKRPARQIILNDAPLSPSELVPGETLLRFAKGEPSWQSGIISEEMQAMLTMYLPDLCGELMAYRAADQESPL